MVDKVDDGHFVLPRRESWNEIVAEIHRVIEDRLRGYDTKPRMQPGEIWIANELASAAPVHTVVAIGDPIVDVGDYTNDLAYRAQHAFKRAETDADTKKLAIMSTSLPANASKRCSRAVVSGVTVAIVDVKNLSHGFAKTTDVDGVLESTDSNTGIRILHSPAVGTTELCKVLIGIAQTEYLLGVTDQAITYNSSGTVRIYDKHLDQPIDTGKTKQAHYGWMADEDQALDEGVQVLLEEYGDGKWRIVRWGCHAWSGAGVSMTDFNESDFDSQDWY